MDPNDRIFDEEVKLVDLAMEIPWIKLGLSGDSSLFLQCPFCMACVFGEHSTKPHVYWHVKTDPRYFRGVEFTEWAQNEKVLNDAGIGR